MRAAFLHLPLALGLAVPIFAAQYALNPDEALKTFQTLPGLKVELVASEPHVVTPAAMAFDEDGRIYAAEMLDFPFIKTADTHGPYPEGQIRLMEDRDGDGVVDHSTIFATAIWLPTSVLPYEGGVLVAAAPEILFLKDTDGDGRADVREVVLTGFDTENDLYRVNSLYYGNDGWIYARGVGDKPLHWGDRPDGPALSTGGGDFRFKPREHLLEPLAGLSSCFGETMDDRGRRFISNSAEHIHQLVLPKKYSARNPNLVTPSSRAAISDHEEIAKIFRISPPQEWRVERGASWEKDGLVAKYGHIEPRADYMTAVTGPLVYRETLLPAEFRGNYFVCEAVGNLVHRDVLSGAGPVLKASRADEGREFLASSDSWFSPVYLTSGPDGAIYVCDMHRQMIEHPGEDGHDAPNVPYQILRKYGMRAGATMGRIYRIAPEMAGPMKRPHLSTATPAELAAHLGDDAAWWRTTAQRLLLAHPETAPVDLIENVATKGESAAGRSQALQTLAALGKLRPDLISGALADADAGVRETAIALAEQQLTPPLEAALLPLAADPDASVRYQLAFTLGEMKSPTRLAALATIARRDAADRYIRTAVLSSVNDHEMELFAAALSDAVPENLAPFLKDLAQVIGARNIETETGEVKKFAADENSALSSAAKKALLDGLSAGRKLAGGKPAKQAAKPLPAPVPAATASAPVSAEYERLKPALDMKGDAARGKIVFTERCATCHRAGGAGTAVGPDLASVGTHPSSQILFDIVEPNAAVIPNFQLYTIEANDGEMLAGIVAAQSDTSITLRRAAGEESTILRRNIKTLTNTKTSLMPPGLLGGLTPQQVADLITFISQSP